MVNNHTVTTIDFNSWPESVTKLLDYLNIKDILPADKPIMLKPNLVENLQPPITTPVEFVREIVEYLQDHCFNNITIGEGCGSLEYDTAFVFKQLGYEELAAENNIELIDLNQQDLTEIHNEQLSCWPKMYLPSCLFDVFLISLPVLKAHSLAGVTLTMKNMMGLAPPSHFQQGGHWKKAAFHSNIDLAVADLNRYRCPDLTILDATIGMQEAHLWGPICEPPKKLLAAAQDPVAIDAWGADLLGFGWQNIGHIREVDGELGSSAYREEKI